MKNNYKMRWDQLTIAVFLTFSIWAPLFAIPPMETILTKNFSISHFQVGLLFSGPVIMLALVAIPAGIIADKIGIKRAIGIGAILALIGAVLRGTATSYLSLFFFSLVLGLGLGFSFTNLPKLARALSLPRQTTLIMGILNGGGVMAGIGVALAITVPLIYPLTNSYSGVFYIWSIPLLIATVLWWTLVSESPRTSSKIETEKVYSPKIKRLFQNKILWLLAVLLFLHNFLFYTWSGWIPTYLLERGFSAGSAGLTTSIMLWVSIPTVILVPLLTSKANLPRKIFIWIPSLAYAFLSAGILYASGFTIWLIMATSGFVNVLRFNTLLTLPVEFAPAERAGAASGIVVAFGYIGAVAGPIISGQILDVTGSFTVIFGILVMVSLISTGLAFFIPGTSH
jgi:MFS transporter, CP family, cyanate transporter